MRKVTVLLSILLSLLCKVTFAEDIGTIPKLFDDFKNSFSESMSDREVLFNRDVCTEEESYNSPWKCQDNYYFLANDGEEYYLHKRQNDELKHILLESNLKAIKQTKIGQELSDYFDQQIKPYFRAKIGQESDGNIFLTLPGVKKDIENVWEISFKPKFYRLNDNFGYNFGLEINAIFFDNFSLNTNWRFEEDEINSGISYKIAKNKNLSVIAQKSSQSKKIWVFFSWQF